MLAIRLAVHLPSQRQTLRYPLTAIREGRGERAVVATIIARDTALVTRVVSTIAEGSHLALGIALAAATTRVYLVICPEHGHRIRSCALVVVPNLARRMRAIASTMHEAGNNGVEITSQPL